MVLFIPTPASFTDYLDSITPPYRPGKVPLIWRARIDEDADEEDEKDDPNREERQAERGSHTREYMCQTSNDTNLYFIVYEPTTVWNVDAGAHWH